MKPLAWSILLVFPVGALAADIYRSVDENGVVVYSDLPTHNAERIVTQAPGRPAPARPTAAAARPETDSENAGPEPTIFAEIPREPTPEEIAEDRARNCQAARQMFESYTTSHRLFTQGPNGERNYLSDAEIDAKRAEAEANVAAWCD